MPLLDRLPKIAERAVSGARKAGSLALPAVRRVAEPLQRRRTEQDRGSSKPSGPGGSTSEPAAPEPAAAAPPVTPTAPATVPEPSAAEHVDREAVVVAESSDPGADGVGAQIHVEEPWDGYGELDEQGVIAELSDASPEKLAVVRLYETMHGDRSAVIEEIDRKLEAAAG